MGLTKKSVIYFSWFGYFTQWTDEINEEVPAIFFAFKIFFQLVLVDTALKAVNTTIKDLKAIKDKDKQKRPVMVIHGFLSPLYIASSAV